MATQAYEGKNFSEASLALIAQMVVIVDDYIDQGYRLTVRQLYYQLVARAVVENTEKSYKRITGLVNDAKLAGLMDWEAIEDRTREFIRRTRWQSPQDILRASSESFHMDMWHGQPRRAFVIVEKEALAGVLERACHALDTPLLAARGYPSGTVLREFAVGDVQEALNGGQAVTIIHLGDHDPSGIDMTRDLDERLRLFAEDDSVEIDRIALTRRQIKDQKPPPNPAKTTDSRFKAYRIEHGSESWELDALKPEYLDRLVRSRIQDCIEDQDAWDAMVEKVDRLRTKIKTLADTFKE